MMFQRSSYIHTFTPCGLSTGLPYRLSLFPGEGHLNFGHLNVPRVELAAQKRAAGKVGHSCI